MVVILLYDLIVAASNTLIMYDVKSMLHIEFKMKDLGVLSWFWGIQFKDKEDSIEMNQSSYIESVLCKFDMRFELL